MFLAEGMYGMPRKRRIWYPGATYHVMCRGNHRHDIFRDDEDRQLYLCILEEAVKRYRCYLLAYCLMTNHVHLQIETSDVEIWVIMKHLNARFAMHFNRKYNFVGHLFQGRYRAEIIEDDPHNLETSKYIHLNPVMANMVTLPAEYEWSSYRNYLGERNDGLVSVNKILGYFNNSNPLQYQKYVEMYIDTGE